ncbi:MAG: redoxin domain-containing protein [Thermoguttaceae bacterium]
MPCFSRSLSLSASLSLGLMLALFVGCQRGEPAKKPDADSSKQAVDAKAESQPTAKLTNARQVLEHMIAAYRKASTYQDQGTIRLLAEADGRKVRDITASFSMVIERPNKVRVEAYSGRLVSDGKRVFAAVEGLPGQVLLTDAPKSLTLRSVYRDLVLTDAMTQEFGGAMPQVMLMLGEQPMAALTQGGAEPILAESGEINGHECYRVKISREIVGTTTFWIDAKTFLLRRVVLPADELRQMLSQEQPIDSMSVIADFPGAAFNEKISPTAFLFEVPKVAVAVSYLIPPHVGQLLKAKTPPFRFQTLDGKPVTPETLAGKTAVLLFWSIQFNCKPSLQEIERIYQQCKSNPKVAFYAVCVDPPELKNADAVRAIEDLKVHVPLLRDPDQTHLGLKVQPPTVLIISDKGIVQHCESGFAPTFGKTLVKKIEKVIAGEDVYHDALKQYQQILDRLGDYAKLADQPENAPAADKRDAEVKLPETKTAPKTEPAHLKLTSLWKCTEIKSPGNMLVLTGAGGPRLLVVENWKSLAEVGLDGKLLARHSLNVAPDEYVGCLRTATDGAGHRYVATFLMLQQRCHLLDENWKAVADYPQDALQNPHSGMTDVQLGDLDGRGRLTLFVSYAGLVGVQGVTLDGRRLWSNRTIANVSSLAIAGPNTEGHRALLCANASQSLRTLDAQGKTLLDVPVADLALRRIAAADLRGDGQPLFCGLPATAVGENLAIGFSLRGEQLWKHQLPDGVPPRPIEPIIAGRVTQHAPGQWLLPGPDGSIHILAADGTLLDKFNYGEPLQGMTTVDIDGRPTLVVATEKAIEAWRVDAEPRK